MKTRISPNTNPRNSAGMPTGGNRGDDGTGRDHYGGDGDVTPAVLGDGPRVEEQELDVEQQEDDRHQIVSATSNRCRASPIGSMPDS